MNQVTRLQVYLFTDLVGSTALKRQLGDVVGAAAIAAHDSLFRDCLARYGGTEQNSPGDGFFATFPLPSSALKCALDFQKGLAQLDVPEPLLTRVGIHMGESVHVASDRAPDKLLGLAIDTSGRVMSLAEGRQILLTRHAFDSARQQVQEGPGGDPLEWRAHGPYVFKGLDEPLEIFEAGIAGISLLEPPKGSAKAQRAVAPGEEETLGWRPAVDLEVPGRRGWVLQKKLGEGGFGEVWLVASTRTKTQRAFKFCFRADRLQSLKRELTLFRLMKEALGDREDIARLYDVQLEESPFYLEMEYTAGGSLDRFTEETEKLSSITKEARTEFVAEVADALAAAHSVGILHKDIKPSNVLVRRDPDGRAHARLTDFGVGQLFHRDALDAAQMSAAGFTETGMLTDLGSRTGTRTYMAPELWTGKPATIASDVYALGVLLYQLVRGDLVHPLAQGWEAHIEDPLLREDIAACVAGDPKRRPASAEIVADRLRRLDERREERAAKRRRALAETRRRSLLRFSGIAAVVLLVALIGTAIAVVRVNMARRDAEDAGGKLKKALIDAKIANTAASKAQRSAYSALIQAASLSLTMNGTRDAKQLLARCPEPNRGWEWRHLHLRADTSSSVLEGHTGSVTAVAFLAGRLASASLDGTVRMWSSDTGETALEMAGASDAVTALAFSADGRMIAAASKGDMLVRVWDSESAQLLGVLSASDSPVTCLAFSADGSRLATGSVNDAHLWDTKSFKRVSSFEHAQRVQAVAFSADGAQLAAATASGVSIWETKTSRLLRTIQLRDVTCLAYTRSGARIAAGSLDAAIHLLDPATGEEKRKLTGHTDPVSALAFGPKDARLVSASFDTTVRVWDLENGSAPAVLLGHDGPVLAVAHDGSAVVSGAADNTVRLWDMARSDATLTLRGDEDFLAAVAFHPSDDTVAAASAGHGEIRVWNATTGAEVRYIPEQGGALSSLAFSADGQWLAAGCEEDATGSIYDWKTGKLVHTLEGHELSVTSVAFGPEGDRVATGSADRTIRVWNAQSGKVLRVLEGHQAGVSTVAFSSDGRVLLSAAQDGTACLWELGRDAGPVLTIRAHVGAVSAAIFDPAEDHIVTAGADRTIRFWDVKSGKAVRVLRGHAAAVSSIAFSRDGTRLVSGSRDKTIRIWDPATGETRLRLRAHDVWVKSVAFSPDGTRIASASYDTTVKVWRTSRAR